MVVGICKLRYMYERDRYLYGAKTFTVATEARETILVVEDEAKIAEVLISYLEREGFLVVCAADGEAALRLFAAYAPALVLLDLMLPKRSGEEVCRAIRAAGDTPIIMLTAKTEENSTQ